MITPWYSRLFDHQLSELWHRIKYGQWCDHHTVTLPSDPTVTVAGWSPWKMANLGANKYRRCKTCRRFEWV